MATTNGIGQAIRQLRQDAGLTLREVCDLAGVGLRYLSQVENGIVTPASKWTAHVIEVLGEQVGEKKRGRAA
jgi:transcriptional regulator with XRE-family HTH domain